jgi:hypothetical protein
VRQPCRLSDRVCSSRYTTSLIRQFPTPQTKTSYPVRRETTSAADAISIKTAPLSAKALLMSPIR